MSLAHYQAAFAQLPAEVRDARMPRFQDFERVGFPKKKLEDWRYSDLTALADKSFALPSPASADLSALALAGTELRSFVNGGDGAYSIDARSDGGSIVALNAAFARDGLMLDVPANQQLATPLHVLTWVDDAKTVMAHLYHRIRLAENAEATVILHHSGRGEYLTTQVCEIELGANARMTLYRLQDESANSSHLMQIEAKLGRDSMLKVVNIDLGQGLARQDLNVHLNAPGAQAQLYGLYAPGGRSHIDNHTRIHHHAPHCTSREFFRGVVSGSARAVFNGKVQVHEHAIKTDSETRVANLLLSKTAEVYAKPELEIYNDDVKCAHGATFGQLDDEALFYLRSRGLSTELARALLTQAFAQQIIDEIGLEGLRERVTQRFLQGLTQATPKTETQ